MGGDGTGEFAETSRVERSSQVGSADLNGTIANHASDFAEAWFELRVGLIPWVRFHRASRFHGR
jgi:hypothetical protein